jgi:hypothetical protein
MNAEPLQIPVPPSPILENAFGYFCKETVQYIAVWWAPSGDEVVVSDGRITFTGYGWGYLTYVNHPLVKPYLKNYNLGSSEFEAEDALIINLFDQKAYVLNINEARLFVQSQWAHDKKDVSCPLQIVSTEDLERLIQETLKNYRIPPLKRSESLEFQKNSLNKLGAWLTAQSLPKN